ncbi:hypothetical protein [Alkalihalobacillus sp. R86527]|uniref:hypothetical protein n=1 Tax=Alkalihalobacillus sp. R86527 TaxID=3093863 RepID=UPI00366C5C14
MTANSHLQVIIYSLFFSSLAIIDTDSIKLARCGTCVRVLEAFLHKTKAVLGGLYNNEN